jgi:hypothetical protein
MGLIYQLHWGRRLKKWKIKPINTKETENGNYVTKALYLEMGCNLQIIRQYQTVVRNYLQHPLRQRHPAYLHLAHFFIRSLLCIVFCKWTLYRMSSRSIS